MSKKSVLLFTANIVAGTVACKVINSIIDEKLKTVNKNLENINEEINEIYFMLYEEKEKTERSEELNEW